MENYSLVILKNCLDFSSMCEENSVQTSRSDGDLLAFHTRNRSRDFKTLQTRYVVWEFHRQNLLMVAMKIVCPLYPIQASI